MSVSARHRELCDAELGLYRLPEHRQVVVNELTSPIPQSFLALDMLEVFDFEDNAGLCAPNTTEFVTWLQSIDEYSAAGNVPILVETAQAPIVTF